MSETSNISATHILMDEANHRFANELANAQASLLLTKTKLGVETPLLTAAIARIEAQTRLHRLLSTGGTGSLSSDVLAISQNLLASRIGSSDIDVAFDRALRPVPERCHRIALLALYELINNAFKHGRDSGVLDIRISTRARNLFIRALNEPGSTGSVSFSKRNLAVLAALANSIGGTLRSRWRESEVRVTVVLPYQ